MLKARPDDDFERSIGGPCAITAELLPVFGCGHHYWCDWRRDCRVLSAFLDKLKIDDVVGAIPVHLFAGIWGTIAVVFTNGDASLGTQLYSIIVVGIFVTVASAIVWFILKATMGIRVSEEDEINGLDMSELGMDAYPEFSKANRLSNWKNKGPVWALFYLFYISKRDAQAP